MEAGSLRLWKPLIGLPLAYNSAVGFRQSTSEVIRSISEKTLQILDWGVQVVERLIVLGVAAIVFRFGYHLYRGALSPAEDKSLPLVAQNWKIIFLLLIPLFYQTVRTFLEEVQEIWGMTRPKRGVTKGEDDEQSPKEGG